MKRSYRSIILASISASSFHIARVDAQVATGWKGTGANNNWSTAANWDNTGPSAGARDLFFGNAWSTAGGVGTTTAQNDIVNYHGHKIFFENIASPVTFRLQGNAITLFDFGGATPVFPQIQNNSSANQIFSIPVAFNDTSANNKAEINPVNGNLQFDNAVDMAGANTQLQIFGNNGKTVTFNAPITSSGNTGSNSFAINQNSTVILRAANTYIGQTFVNAGHLQFDVGGSLAGTIRLGDTGGTASAAIDLLTAAGGLTVDRTINPRAGTTGNTLSFNSLNTSGTNTYSGHVGLDHDFLVTQAAGGTMNITQLRSTPADTLSGFDIKGFTSTFFADGNINVAGTIYNSTGSGNIIKNATGGYLTLTADNTYSGTTTINEGTLQIGAGTTSGSITQTTPISSTGVGGTLAFNRSNTLLMQNVISGNVSLAQIGAGTTEILNVSSTGATFIGAGTLQVGVQSLNGNLGSGPIIDNANLAFARDGTITQSNPITGTGNVAQNGVGTLILIGSHAYSGATFVNNGTLVLNGSTTSLGSSEIQIAARMVQNDGTVTIPGADSLRIAPTAGQNGTYTMNGGVLNANGISFPGSIRVGEGGNGALIITGGVVNSKGVVNLGYNTAATGTVNQSGGTIEVGTILTGQNASVFVGRGPSSFGKYSISNGSLLVHGNLQVGFTGAGSFDQTGGNVTVDAGTGQGFLFIANGPTSVSTYRISAGSLNCGNGIIIGGDAGGAGGTGTLTIDGGTVNAGPGMTIWNNGTLNLNAGVLNVGTNALTDNIFCAGTINNNGGQLNLAGRIYGTGVINNASGNVVFSNGTDVGIQDVKITGGSAIDNGTLTVGRNAGSIGILNISGGSTTINGVLGVGNNGTLGAGNATAQGHVNVSAGSLYADTIVLGNSTGGSGNMTINGTGNVTVGGGFSQNDLNVNGGTLTVLDQAPPPGEDPVLDRSVVGGYLRDGAMNVTSGVVTSPKIKLGVTSGKTGTYTQSAGSVQAGTILLGSSDGGIGSMTLSGTAALLVDTLLNVAPTGSFDISGSARVDMTSANGIVDYTGASPLATVQALLASGYNDGNWDGNGINSSTAASQSGAPHKTALGYAENSDLGLASFAGQNVDADSVLIKYTLYGDANLDGTVNTIDFNLLAAGFSQPGKPWFNGDFDYSGTVNTVDFNLLASNFAQTLSAPIRGAAPEIGGLVPEPSAMGLVALVGVLARRRRSKTRI